MSLARAPDHPKETSRGGIDIVREAGSISATYCICARSALRTVVGSASARKAPEVLAGLGAAFHQRGQTQAQRSVWQGHHIPLAGASDQSKKPTRCRIDITRFACGNICYIAHLREECPAHRVHAGVAGWDWHSCTPFLESH